MEIIQCAGYELEKEKSNTSEDFFNRSEITYIDDGVEKTLHVLYVRYFDEIFTEFTPFQQDPVFAAGAQPVFFKDIVALVCLVKNPGLRQRKRLYLNNQEEFAAYFKDVNLEKIAEVFQALQQNQEYELRSPLEFILQPN
ncbi:hypothetical protein ACF5W4_11860 [Bacillota bacterium Lsc_1132]